MGPAMDFAGKRVIITGASTGIGEELAVSLARKGARLTLAARSREPLKEVAARCVGAGGEALIVPTDVTDPNACGALVAESAERYGAVDALVCNAGLSMWARFEDVQDLGVFERIMQVNYLGAVYCTHYALPHLRKSRGLLVAVSSLTGITGVPTRTAYAASKHAVQGFFDSLRIELQGTGVDVLVISPGFVATGIRDRALGADGRPIGKSPRREDRGTMSLDECVREMVRAMEARQRELVMTRPARIGRFLKLVTPGLVDRFAARAVQGNSGSED
jgi:short-subunit dehydrogenase